MSKKWGYKYKSVFKSKKKAKAYADHYRSKKYEAIINKVNGKYHVYIYKRYFRPTPREREAHLDWQEYGGRYN